MRADAHDGAPLLTDAAGAAGPLAALAVRAAAGDGDAFEALMQATQPRVAALAWRILGSREDARDATQEVYLRVHRSLRAFRPDGEFEAWLHRIAVNVCRDHLRRRRPERSLGDALPEPVHHDDLEGRAAEAQRSELLRRALASLPPKERLAIVLRDLEGRSTDEVARILGSSAVTVRVQVCRARQRLKASFERSGK